MERIVFHIDVNSAYLSWSALKRLESGDDIDLRQIPSIVGGDMERRHGVVLSKYNTSKKYCNKKRDPIFKYLSKFTTFKN